MQSWHSWSFMICTFSISIYLYGYMWRHIGGSTWAIVWPWDRCELFSASSGSAVSFTSLVLQWAFLRTHTWGARLSIQLWIVQWTYTHKQSALPYVRHLVLYLNIVSQIRCMSKKTRILMTKLLSHQGQRTSLRWGSNESIAHPLLVSERQDLFRRKKKVSNNFKLIHSWNRFSPSLTHSVDMFTGKRTQIHVFFNYLRSI